MPSRYQNRDDFDEQSTPSDRRVNQPRGEIDIADLDEEDVSALREEDLNNLNENELSQLDAEIGVQRASGGDSRLIPSDALHDDLEKEEADALKRDA